MFNSLLINIFVFFFLNIICAIISFKIANLFNFIDFPNKRKIHSKPTVLIGGIFFFLSLSIWLITIFNLDFFNLNYFINNIYLLSKKDSLVVYLLLTTSGLVGLLADKEKLKPLSRLIFQLIILLFFYFFLDSKFILETLQSYLFAEFTINYGKVLFTIFCIMLLVHAFNLMDGINGLASTVALTWSIFLLWQSSFQFNYIFLLLLITSTSLFIFSILNLMDKCFLGDGGNYIISTTISISSIFIYNSQLTQLNPIKIEFFFLLFMLPGIDMARLFIYRLINNKNPLSPDRDHFHHILFNYFRNHFFVCFFYIAFIVTAQFALLYYEINCFLIILVGFLIYFSIIYFHKKNKK